MLISQPICFIFGCLCRSSCIPFPVLVDGVCWRTPARRTWTGRRGARPARAAGILSAAAAHQPQFGQTPLSPRFRGNVPPPAAGTLISTSGSSGGRPNHAIWPLSCCSAGGAAGAGRDAALQHFFFTLRPLIRTMQQHLHMTVLLLHNAARRRPLRDGRIGDDS